MIFFNKAHNQKWALLIHNHVILNFTTNCQTDLQNGSFLLDIVPEKLYFLWLLPVASISWPSNSTTGLQRYQWVGERDGGDTLALSCLSSNMTHVTRRPAARTSYSTPRMPRKYERPHEYFVSNVRTVI